ncbi:MAG: glycosyltransferase family 9 protein [Bacteroidetes bacterium]|nr:glycosyltransferase family 9 protein [Bacteroidota bacterium]
MEFKKIIISRTDGIGDVILTLPLVGYLRSVFPRATLIFLGRSYTIPVLKNCHHIDEYIDYDELQKLDRDQQVEEIRKQKADVFIHVFPRKDLAHIARKADIKIRIGTSHRFYHWISCTHPVAFSRKNSDLHEAQLNFKLLAPLDITIIPTLRDLEEYYGIVVQGDLSKGVVLSVNKKKVILHPKSQGSAVEWGIKNFENLAELLLSKGFQVILTGTAKEKELIASSSLFKHPGIIDVMGKLNLQELMVLINHSDALVAASTGPLHIAAALGKRAVGIYSERKPIHPGRWSPVGKNAVVLSKVKEGGSDEELDALMKTISTDQVLNALQQ